MSENRKVKNLKEGVTTESQGQHHLSDDACFCKYGGKTNLPDQEKNFEFMTDYDTSICDKERGFVTDIQNCGNRVKMSVEV